MLLHGKATTWNIVQPEQFVAGKKKETNKKKRRKGEGNTAVVVGR
jgi:hypothetical protein